MVASAPSRSPASLTPTTSLVIFLQERAVPSPSPTWLLFLHSAMDSWVFSYENSYRPTALPLCSLLLQPGPPGAPPGWLLSPCTPHIGW